MAEKVIIDIDIDNDGAVKATKDLTSSIIDQTDAIKQTNTDIKELEKSNKLLATQNKELNSEIKKGNVDRTEGNKQIESNTKAIDTNNAKIKQNKVEVIGQKDALSKTNAERKAAIKTMNAEVGSIDSLRDENSKLTKARNAVNITTKEGQDRVKEINSQLDKNNSIIKLNSDELLKQKLNIGNYQSALDGVNKEITISSKQISKFSSENKKLGKELRSLNKTTEEGKKREAELNTQIEKNNKTIGENSKRIKEAKTQTKNLEKEIKKADAAFEKNKKEIEGNTKAIKAQGKAFDDMPGPIGTVRAAFNKLIANPIFLIIAALVVTLKFLGDAFTRSSKGQDLLAKGMGVLKGLIGVIETAFDKLADIILSVFEDPQQAVEDLWEGIKKNLINRFEGFIDLLGIVGSAIKSAFTFDFDQLEKDLEGIGTAFIQVSTGLDEEQQKKVGETINNIAKEINATVQRGIELEQAKLALRRADIAAITRIAKLEGEVAKARLDASDKLLDAEERVNAIALVEEKSIELVNEQIKLAQSRLEIKKIENSLSKTGLDDLEEEKNLEAAIIRLQTQKISDLRTFGKLKAGILDELADKEIKQAQTVAKETTDTREDELKALVKGFARILESDQLTARKRVDIEKQRADAVEIIKNIAQKKAEDIEKRNTLALEERLELEQEIEREAELELLEGTAEFFEKRQEFALEDFDQRQEDLEEALELKKITQEEFNLRELENQDNFNQQTAANQKGADDKATKDRIKDINKKVKAAKTGAKLLFDILNTRLKNEKQALDKAQEEERIKLDKKDEADRARLQKRFDDGLISKEEFDIASKALDEKAVAEKAALDKKQAIEAHELEIKQFRTNKATKLLNIIIDTAASIMKLLAINPFNIPGALGLGLLGATQAGIVIGANPPPPPSFAEGGQIISGKSHAQGGEDVHVGGRLMGNVQGGEGLFITKREATRDALSHINQTYGGRNFAGRSHTGFFQEGGQIGPVGGNITIEQMQEAFEAAIANQPPPIVQVDDIQIGLDAVNETIEVTRV